MIAGRTLMLLGRALGAIAEGLDFVAETCADASEFATGSGLLLYRRGCELIDGPAAAGGQKR